MKPASFSKTGSFEERPSTLWLAFALVVLVIVIVAAFVQWRELREARGLVLGTRNILSNLEQLESDVRAAESAQRGYVIVGREQYLLPYDAARTSVFECLDELDSTAGAPQEAAAIGKLRLLVQAKFAELEETIALRRIKGFRAAQDVMLTDRGHRLMNDIATTIEALKVAPAHDLRERLRAEKVHGNAAVVITGLGSLTLFVLLSAAMVTIHRQLARQRRLLDDAGSQMQELARSNEELQRFAYVISHDLQEPLRIVSSYVRLLAQRYRGKLDAQADEFIQFAVTHVEHMQNLIRDLLEYSRAGKRSEAQAPVNAEGLLDHALANLEAAITESGALIAREPLPQITANPAQLILVFQNLVGNAIKFRSADPPRIHITAARDGAFSRFAVRDNGRGIEAQHLERIFGLFQRLDPGTEGTGIGLAICRKTVETYGGRIWVESAPGAGSTFFFTLPI